MERKTLTVLFWNIVFLLFISLHVIGQVSTNEIPFGIKNRIDQTQTATLKVEFDPEAIDTILMREAFPMLAGVSLPVNAQFFDKATKVLNNDGSLSWFLKVYVPDAPFLGIVFSGFELKEGDKLFIFDETKKHYIGAFSHQNNSASQLLSTHILPANTLVIEYHQKKADPEKLPNLWVDEMIYILSDQNLVSEITEKSSGSCNVNINCLEGNLWQKQKRGVARILLRAGTSWFNCSGSLVNNTARDGTPYFLTADHCGTTSSEADLQVWQFYFNYEYPECDNTGTAPLNRMITGAQIVSRAPIQNGSDFKLLLLNQTPDTSWDPYYNGWTRSTRDPEFGVCIHHPNGDAKKISTYTTTLLNSTFTGGMISAYWRVNWAETISGHGVTEGGSSGSPLFETNGLITGTLTGGSASCGNPTLPDYYGKFSMHWQENGETDDMKLSPWLDPQNDNPEFLYGYDPNTPTNLVTTDIEPAKSGLVTGTGYYAEFESVNLIAKPIGDYIFKHWINSEQQVVSTNAEFTFQMPENEVYLVAVFDLNQSAYSQLANQGSLHIYPNPARDHINISADILLRNPSVFITDVSGRILIIKEANILDDNHSIKIETSVLDGGVYFLLINSAEGNFKKKLLINR